MPSSPSSNFSWVKAQPGSIDIPSRDPCAADRPIWFRRQAGLESASTTQIITSTRLSPPNPSTHALNLEVVKAAVRQLRFDHPAIASKHGWFAQPPTPDHAVFVYEVPASESDIDTWLSQVVVDGTAVLLESSGDVEKAIDAVTYELGKPASAGLPLFLLHYIPAASPDGQHGLVFIFSHTIFDAVGCFQIMDRCVSKIADSLATGGKRSPLPWGEETLRLPSALVESARIPHTAERLPEDRIVIEKVKDMFKSLPNIHKLPQPHPNTPPSATGLITRILPPDVVTNIRNVARAHGCTIFSVLWAALVLSSVRTRTPNNTTDLTLPFVFSPLDIRPLACDDRYDRSQWTVRLSIGFNSFVARDLGRFVHSSSDNEGDAHQLAEDVWTLGKEVKAQIEEQKQYADRMAVWIDDMMPALVEALVGILGDAAAPPTKWYPILSSIGIMDPYLAREHPVATGGQLTVVSPRLNPVFPTPFGDGCFALHAFTWEGEMVLPFTFPECVMGSVQDQEVALREGRDGDAIALQFINEFMHILDVVSRSK